MFLTILGKIISNIAFHCSLGNSVEVLEGLYVMGGATIPTFMGLNPSLAISYVVERCVRLLAEREGWHINYEFKHIGMFLRNFYFSHTIMFNLDH